MKTKTIFKTLATAMLMPAMLLTTACSSDDDTIVNNPENTTGKGYALPVTVNVTRQGDEATTRATFNGTTLAFSLGDKLFVMGSGTTAGEFAGTLDYDADSEKFSGTIYTENPYSGTYDALFESDGAAAYLLPFGYESHGYLTIYDKNTEAVYDDYIIDNDYKVFAYDKATAVEQFSDEHGYYTSGTGFVLEPHNAILSFTITDLGENTDVYVVVKGKYKLEEKEVTTDASGNASFAIAVPDRTDFEDCSLKVSDEEGEEGKAITLASESKELQAGKIYNVTRSVLNLTTVMWNSSNCSGISLSGEDDEVPIADITLKTDNDNSFVSWNGGIKFTTGEDVYGQFTFIAPMSKKFKRIVMTLSGTDGWDNNYLGGGWEYDSTSKTVTWEDYENDHVSLLLLCTNFSGSPVTSIVFMLVDDDE